MQAVQYRPQFDSVTDGELMPVDRWREPPLRLARECRDPERSADGSDCNGQRILSEYASVPRHEYERLAGYIEQARLKSEQAGADLERQATEHGCYPRLSASAAHFSGAHY